MTQLFFTFYLLFAEKDKKITARMKIFLWCDNNGIN